MKNISFLFLFFCALTFGQTRKVVSADIKWWGYKVVKSGPSSHNGTIRLKSGTVATSGNQLTGGSFVLDMNSISDLDLDKDYRKTLEDHLKDGDFFETSKYPLGYFKITSVKSNADKNYNHLITGNLTVKNKTAPVSFPAKISISSGGVTIISDKFSFDRQKFGVAYRYFMEDILVKDNVDMQLKIVAK